MFTFETNCWYQFSLDMTKRFRIFHLRATAISLRILNIIFQIPCQVSHNFESNDSTRIIQFLRNKDTDHFNGNFWVLFFNVKLAGPLFFVLKGTRQSSFDQNRRGNSGGSAFLYIFLNYNLFGFRSLIFDVLYFHDFFLDCCLHQLRCSFSGAKFQIVYFIRIESFPSCYDDVNTENLCQIILLGGDVDMGYFFYLWKGQFKNLIHLLPNSNVITVT